MSLQRIKEEIIRAQNRIYHEILISPVMWCLGGALIILTIDIFKETSKYHALYVANQDVVDSIYFVWDKFLHVLCFLALFVAYKPLKKYYKYALIYSISSLCYELITMVSPAMDTALTTIMWLTLVVILLFLSFMEYKKNPNQ